MSCSSILNQHDPFHFHTITAAGSSGDIRLSVQENNYPLCGYNNNVSGQLVRSRGTCTIFSSFNRVLVHSYRCLHTKADAFILDLRVHPTKKCFWKHSMKFRPRPQQYTHISHCRCVLVTHPREHVDLGHRKYEGIKPLCMCYK